MKPILESKDLGVRIVARWDESAEVYELFDEARGDEWIGCCDYFWECKKVALDYVGELMQ